MALGNIPIPCWLENNAMCPVFGKTFLLQRRTIILAWYTSLFFFFFCQRLVQKIASPESLDRCVQSWCTLLN